MNVSTHQKKKDREKTGKKEAGEKERIQSTDFSEVVCFPFAVVERVPRRKNGLYEESARGN